MSLVLATIPKKEPWEDYPQSLGQSLAAKFIANAREYVKKNRVDEKIRLIFQRVLDRELERKRRK